MCKIIPVFQKKYNIIFYTITLQIIIIIIIIIIKQENNEWHIVKD